MRSNLVKAHRGFTLIELLLAITVIVILSSLSFGLFKAARNGNNKSKALGEIQALSMACENYKKLYGDYPCGRNSGSSDNDTNFANDLFDQIMGRKVIRKKQINNLGENALILSAYNDSALPGGTSRQIKPLLSAGIVASDNDKDLGLSASPSPTAAKLFQDPWGNPYGYRYRILPSASTAFQSATTGQLAAGYSDWKASAYLLVSCGVEYGEPATTDGPPLTIEYWDPASASAGPMTKSGLIPSTYRDQIEGGPKRADNIVNWEN